MGLIKTLIVSGAAIAVAKEFNKKRQDKKHSNGSQCGKDQFNYGPPPPQQHQGYSQPNYQQYAPQGPPPNYYSQPNANQAPRPEKWSKY
ncbi:hypothetical protein X797_007054 [Metarhizium robertsii]|uniref:Uncharacterized protein n=2 Tax=Metarhizium robertsii TaxID=568076 RepID=E9F619_METRA|nr:uncharacterized protein MAA_07718 [Metarhizium robertsii ARSEF 23]EFY96905.1 hypothetical protein MAA_07718 [Metarhizium robertsii ARSEF 23]EXU99925.1 hypothetical protein X797_007054 [Metarhizium robertsii]